MSDTPVTNPYATDQMPEGGGLTRDIVVTSAKYVSYGMTYKDGSPVKDKTTGQQSVFTGLRVEAIRVGTEKTERYEWSAGKKAKPSADGELLLDDKGQPAKIYKTSNLGRAILGLEAGGYDPRLLYPRISVLAGAKLTLEAVQKKDADGKPKTHVYQGKTYEDFDWFPSKYNGGAGSRSAAAQGNGADLTAKAEAAVVAAIAEAGGEMERKDLIRALGTALKGDTDAVKITTLVARPDFHNGRPWTVDGSKLTLGA